MQGRIAIRPVVAGVVVCVSQSKPVGWMEPFDKSQDKLRAIQRSFLRHL
jgi:hypothetical protein